MEKKFNRSLILPIVYLVISTAVLAFIMIMGNADGYGYTGLEIVFCVTPIVMLIGSMVSIFLILKYDIYIGKYIHWYIITTAIDVLIMAVFVINTVSSDIRFSFIILYIVPFLLLIAYIVLLHIKINDIGERTALILTNPLLYYTVFTVVFIIGLQFLTVP